MRKEKEEEGEIRVMEIMIGIMVNRREMNMWLLETTLGITKLS